MTVIVNKNVSNAYVKMGHTYGVAKLCWLLKKAGIAFKIAKRMYLLDDDYSMNLNPDAYAYSMNVYVFGVSRNKWSNFLCWYKSSFCNKVWNDKYTPLYPLTFDDVTVALLKDLKK